MFEAVTDRLGLEELLTFRIRATRSASSTRLVKTVREQIASILALLEDAVVRLFGDAGGAKETRPDTKLKSVLRTVVNRAVAQAFQSLSFYLVVERAVQKFLPEHRNTEAPANLNLCTAEVEVCSSVCFYNSFQAICTKLCPPWSFSLRGNQGWTDTKISAPWPKKRLRRLRHSKRHL